MSLIDWADREQVPMGIGIDVVDINELRDLDFRLGGIFTQRTFTKREREESEYAADRWVYLAGRFAVKEAAFKALAHLTPEKAFDFRIVETLHDPDGTPYIARNSALLRVMALANIEHLLVSISNEGNYAIAFVQAVRSYTQERAGGA